MARTIQHGRWKLVLRRQGSSVYYTATRDDGAKLTSGMWMVGDFARQEIETKIAAFDAEEVPRG